MNSACFSPISVQPLTIIVDCWFKNEEFPNKMAISSAQNSRDKPFFLRKLTGFVPQLWIFDHTLSWFVCSSLHLYLSCSVASFQSFPWFHCDLSRISSFTLSLYPFCLRHNFRRRSLFMRVLSHSDTHHLNRYIVGCECHEISIPRPWAVLFLSNFCYVSSTASESSLLLRPDVDSDLCSFVVVQNGRIRLQNGNRLEELKSQTEESFFSYKLSCLSSLFSVSVQTRRCLVCSSVFLCLSFSVAQFPRFYCALWSAFGLPRVPSFSHSASLSLLHVCLILSKI